MRKNFLEKRKGRLEAKKAKLVARATASNDAAEVRSLNDQITDINEELNEILEELDLIEAEARSAAAQQPQAVNANIVASFRTAQRPGATETRNGDRYASVEYRTAFMAYVQRGVAIPAEFRDDSVANTTTLGAIIPTPILNELINLEQTKYGTLFSKVRKLNVPTGVRIPIAELQATFRWVSESNAKSEKQSGGTIDTYVEFGANMGECRIAQTLLSSIVSLDLFEKEITRILLSAYNKAMDIGIVKDNGVGKITGITASASITNVVNLTAADLSDWAAFRKKVISAIPAEFRDGEWVFNQKTKDGHLDTMVDSNSRPVWKDALDLNTDPVFFSRPASLVSSDILPDFDAASNGDVIGFYWVPEQYAINNNMQYTILRYFDQNENQYVTKMLVICDGKPLNPKAFVILKKSA